MKDRSLLDIVRKRAGHCRSIALFLDYDGTLVPIRKDPSRCFLPEKVKEDIRMLSRSRRFFLCILSGRSLGDIKKLVGIKSICYGGNHGLDISGPGIRYTNPLALKARPTIRMVKRELEKEIEIIEGAWIEDKKFTFTLHFRAVKKEDIPAVEKALERVTAGCRKKEPLSIIKGKKVLELCPDAAWNKGRAALWILKRLKGGYLPVYIGDDQTDETAFKVFRKDGVTIRVGRSKRTSARYCVKGRLEILMFLDQMRKIAEAEGRFPLPLSKKS